PSSATPGSGGDGAFIFAAPGGVFFTGTIQLGHGGGIVYGDFHDVGRISGAPLTAPYSTWTDTTTSDFYIFGGTGGGGAGGDGQLVDPASPRSPVSSSAFGISLISQG